jgi:hypothetical protein
MYFKKVNNAPKVKFLFIPKRYFANSLDIETFRSLIREKVTGGVHLAD